MNFKECGKISTYQPVSNRMKRSVTITDKQAYTWYIQDFKKKKS